MGKIIEENNFTIINGNCIEEIKRIKENNSNIVFISDPPFNIGYHYNEYTDKMDDEEYYSMLQNIFSDVRSVIIHYPESLYKYSIKVSKAPERVISWVYNSNTAKQHRDIAFYDITPDFNKVRQPYKNLNDKRIQERLLRGETGSKLYDWWEINQVKNVSKDKTNHPCQMPIEVMRNIIGILPDDIIVVDPFMGSGTTGVAAIELGRKFIGVELNEEYFNISYDRLINTKKINNTNIFNFTDD